MICVIGARCSCRYHNIRATHFVGHSCGVMEVQLSNNSSCAQVRWPTIDCTIPHHHYISQSGKMEDTRPHPSSPALRALWAHPHFLLGCWDPITCPARGSSFQSHHPPHPPEERGSSTITTPAVSMRTVLESVQMACLTCSSCFAMPKTCKIICAIHWLQKRGM